MEEPRPLWTQFLVPKQMLCQDKKGREKHSCSHFDSYLQILLHILSWDYLRKKKSFKALIKCICCDEKYTLTQTAYFKDNFIQDKELKNKKLELMFNKASHAKYKLQKMTKLLNVWIAYNAYNIKFRKSKLILELKKPFPFQIRIPNWLRMIQTVSNRVQETDTED